MPIRKKKKVKKTKKRKLKKKIYSKKVETSQAGKNNIGRENVFRISKNYEQKIEIAKIKKQATEKKIFKIKDYVVYPKHGSGRRPLGEQCELCFYVRMLWHGRLSFPQLVARVDFSQANSLLCCKRRLALERLVSSM